MDMSNIKVGDWVVDNVGGYCKVLKLDYYPTGELDSVWGYWSDVAEKEFLFTPFKNIKFIFKTKKQAKVIADIVKATYTWEDDDDDYM